MIQNPRIEAEIPGYGRIRVAEYMSIAEAVAALGTKKIMTFRDLALAQLAAHAQHPRSSLTDESGLVREGVIYLPAEAKALFVRESPILDNLDEALTLYEKNDKITLNPSVYLQQAKEDKDKPVPERRVFVLPLTDKIGFINLPGQGEDCTREERELVCDWLLGRDIAEDYFQLHFRGKETRIQGRVLQDFVGHVLGTEDIGSMKLDESYKTRNKPKAKWKSPYVEQLLYYSDGSFMTVDFPVKSEKGSTYRIRAREAA
jgi:hypothetical protein